jgi:hypothetical protein
MAFHEVKSQKRCSFWFKRREVLVPRWPTVIVCVIVCCGLTVAGFASIHPFLAISEPLPEADVLAVEGWLADYNLKPVIEEYRSGSYEIVGVTGTPIDKGSLLIEYGSYAEVTARSLLKLGLEESDMMVAPAENTLRHRTFHSAKAMLKALNSSGRETKAITVVTETIHARRSRMVFRKVFGESVEVGIIALPNESYDNERWWGSSHGIKAVGMEILALAHEWMFDSGRSVEE